MGSRIKSIPSRLASLAAGTKSESPENNTIWSTNFFKAKDAISIPIFMSTPFWRTDRKTSSSFKSDTFILPFRRSCVTAGRISQFPLSFNVPTRRATLRFCLSAPIRSIRNLCAGVLLKSTALLVIGLWAFSLMEDSHSKIFYIECFVYLHDDVPWHIGNLQLVLQSVFYLY